MGVDVSLTLSAKQQFSLDRLLTYLPAEHRIGISDIDFSLANLKDDVDYSGCFLTIYDGTNIGRGFSIAIEEAKINLRLNAGCSAIDIDIFHYYLKKILDDLHIPTFEIDEVAVNSDNLEEIVVSLRSFNLNFIKDEIANNKVECIWGALFPIFFEDAFLAKLTKQKDEQLLAYYGSYLNDKQQLDAYYCKNLIYESKEDRSIVGLYVLTEDVPSIFPTTKLDPFFIGNIELDRQLVGLVYDIAADDSHKKFQVSYDDFIAHIDLKKYKDFDKKRVVYTLKNQDIKKMLPYRID